MHERAFVLEPLAEIAPDASVPGYGPVAQLLERVGRGGVEKLDAT
jgi:2-amino-4-hydroxy-6-hydroxymethyldihydropteridine diphosphokinase